MSVMSNFRYPHNFVLEVFKFLYIITITYYTYRQAQEVVEIALDPLDIQFLHYQPHNLIEDEWWGLRHNKVSQSTVILLDWF